MPKILIVVDFQNDFVTGTLGSKAAQAIVPNVQAKIKEYQDHGEQIIFTRDTHYEDYLETQEGKFLPVKHCIVGTEGWNIYDGIDKGCRNCTYVDKNTFGWWDWWNELNHFMDNINEIEICGLCTDICVVSNALILKASFPEIKMTVDAQCCTGTSEEAHKAALLTMKSCQINIINE